MARGVGGPDPGTVRAVQTNGTMVEPTYFPYGEAEDGGRGGREQFATYRRDSTASAQDYAMQRYYSNNTGRFFSSDPLRHATSAIRRVGTSTRMPGVIRSIPAIPPACLPRARQTFPVMTLAMMNRSSALTRATSR